MESEKILEFDLSEQRKWSLLPFSLVRLVRSLKQIVAFWALSSEFWWVFGLSFGETQLEELDDGK